VVFVTNRSKTIIEDHFDYNLALEDLLQRTGKLDMLEQVRAVAALVNLLSVRRKKQPGLGHAVACPRRGGKNAGVAMALAHSEYASAREAGGAGLGTACTYCQMRLGSSALSGDLPAPGMGQAAGPRPQPPLPVATVSRILGAALGLWPLEERLEPPSGTAPVF